MVCVCVCVCSFYSLFYFISIHFSYVCSCVLVLNVYECCVCVWHSRMILKFIVELLLLFHAFAKKNCDGSIYIKNCWISILNLIKIKNEKLNFHFVYLICCCCCFRRWYNCLHICLIIKLHLNLIVFLRINCFKR